MEAMAVRHRHNMEYDMNQFNLYKPVKDQMEESLYTKLYALWKETLDKCDYSPCDWKDLAHVCHNLRVINISESGVLNRVKQWMKDDPTYSGLRNWTKSQFGKTPYISEKTAAKDIETMMATPDGKAFVEWFNNLPPAEKQASKPAKKAVKYNFSGSDFV